MTQEHPEAKFSTLVVIALAAGLIAVTIIFFYTIASLTVFLDTGWGKIAQAADDWCISYHTEYPYHNGQLTIFKDSEGVEHLAMKCSTNTGAAVWHYLEDMPK